jgi:hypothetical protein
MKKINQILLVSAVSLPALSLAGPMPSTVIYTSNLSLNQVAHHLIPASGAAKSPHPFYKNFCAKHQTAVDYSHASGHAVMQYTPTTGMVKFAIAYQGLSGPAIMAHFHIGGASVGGPIVQTICGNPPPGNKALGYSALPAAGGKYCPSGRSGFVTGSFKVTGNDKVTNASTSAKIEKALADSDIYINIHTCLNEPGELRGQLKPAS